MAKKKSYNPFKMWGAYAGALLLISFLTLLGGACFSIVPGFGCSGRSWSFTMMLGWWSNTFTNLDLASIALGIIVSGFLFGWGIHSLIRRLRK